MQNDDPLHYHFPDDYNSVIAIKFFPRAKMYVFDID